MAGFRLCALLIRIILLLFPRQYLYTVYTTIHIYTVFYLFIWPKTTFASCCFSPASFSSIFASYGVALVSLCLFCFLLFFFLFIGVQSTLPSIQASLLTTSTSFFRLFLCSQSSYFLYRFIFFQIVLALPKKKTSPATHLLFSSIFYDSHIASKFFFQ